MKSYITSNVPCSIKGRTSSLIEAEQRQMERQRRREQRR